MNSKKCQTKHCSRTATKGKFCSCCDSRNYRKKNPIRCAFINLRFNSKRRGVEFDLTLDQFAEFCHATDYIAGRGRPAASYSIDRIDNSKGYTIDNIQILSLADNSSKGRKVLVFDWRHPDQAHVMTRKTYQPNIDDPF